MTQPLSKYEFAYIDFSNPKSLLSYAKKLEGHTFREVLDLGITPEGLLEEKSSYNEVAFKGGVGTLIEERYFGYKANSDARADFTDAGVERFLQSSLVLPAITEALSLLRREEMLEKGELDRHYMGTIWADSLYAALARMGFESLADQSSSDYELANKLLGNVEGDSLINLEQRLTEWSTIRDEDDVL